MSGPKTAEPLFASQLAGVVVTIVAIGPSVLVIIKLIVTFSLQPDSEIMTSYDRALKLSALFPLFGILGDHS